MHDLVIRGGTVVDGTGAERFRADVAIDGEHVVAVSGPDEDPIGPGRREIDAYGMIVTPGWVDIHTHYDGQVTWDADLAPSSVNGVTSILVGNCGVGFAPVAPAHHMVDRAGVLDTNSPRHTPEALRLTESRLGVSPCIRA